MPGGAAIGAIPPAPVVAPAAAAAAAAALLGKPVAGKPERFTGERNTVKPRTFLFQMEQYHLVTGITDPKLRAINAGSYLAGRAAEWYVTFAEYTAKKGGELTFQAFQEALLHQYEPVDPVQVARDKLHTLVQRGSAASYCNEFRRLCAIIPDLSESTQMDFFVRGLKVELQVYLVGREVSSLEKAIHMVVEYENRVQHYSRRAWGASSSHQGTRGHDGASSSAAAPMELGSIEDAGLLAVSNKPGGKQKDKGRSTQPYQHAAGAGSRAAAPAGARTPLSPEEKQRLTELGACFYCRRRTDPPHRAVNCPLRRQGNGRTQ